MATQQVYNPPTEQLPTFNSSVFSSNNTGALTVGQADARYLKFPYGQGAETLPSALTVQGLTTLNGGLTSSTTTKIRSSYLCSDTINSSYNINNTPTFTSGSNNCFFGYDAGKSVTSGGTNIAFGQLDCLRTCSVGNSNTAIGSGALKLATADFNTSVGYNAGTALTSGINNTFLGATTTSSSSTVTNSTAVGYGANITASNQITLGTATETVVCPNTLSATGLITANSGISTTTVGFSYSTLPTFTSSQIGYTTSYTFPASQVAGSTTYPITLGVGIWQVFANITLATSQTNAIYHKIEVASNQYAFSVCAPFNGANYNYLPTISAIVGLTGSTAVNYVVSLATTTNIVTANGSSRFYAVRIA